MLRLPAIKRRWVQWSLRGFLVLIAAFAVGFAWYGARLRREARINNAVRLIEASPGWFPSYEYDPIALVHAVNALHALGKDDAIQALRWFAAEYPSKGGPSDTHEALRLVIPLLFDRLDPEDRLPEEGHFENQGKYQSEANKWPEFSAFIIVDRDIPFHRIPSVGYSGEQRDFCYAIDWAERYGRLRTTELTPADDPLDAADHALERLAREQDQPVDSLQIRVVREHALRAVAHLLPASEVGKYDSRNAGSHQGWRNLKDDGHWSRLKGRLRPLAIRWCARKQTYVATRREI